MWLEIGTLEGLKTGSALIYLRDISKVSGKKIMGCEEGNAQKRVALYTEQECQLLENVEKKDKATPVDNGKKMMEKFKNSFL